MPIKKPKIADTIAPIMMAIISLTIPLVMEPANKPEIHTPVKAPMHIKPAWPKDSSPEMPTTKLSKNADLLLTDIECNTVKMTNNYDDTVLEPTVLPVAIPLLLINGSTGIASGYATNMAPHNLNEVVNATIFRLTHPTCTLDKVMSFIKGPDFPTGGIVQGKADVRNCFKTGKGKIVLRGKAEIVDNKSNQQIIITEIPYEIVKSSLVKRITDLSLGKDLDGISDVRDESGKKIKDKRGGEDNIHSWDLEMKGHITAEQKDLLNHILHERRKHKWAEIYGIEWMDGMPLTIDMIRQFYDTPNLENMLHDLVDKGYLVYECPKKVVVKTSSTGTIRSRERDESLPKGYNIVAGKLSFEVSEILDPNGCAPTLVAMDMHRIHVVDGEGLRQLTLTEGKRLFGYPDSYKLDVPIKEGYDLLGNTVVVPVIKAVATKLLNTIQ